MEELNLTHYVVKLEIKYCSSIEARDVEVLLGDTNVHVGSLHRGVRVIQVVVEKIDVEAGVQGIEMSIGGLFRLKIAHR